MLAEDEFFVGVFPLIGATANCSSYQNPRRGLGPFNTGTGAFKALVNKICICSCFIISFLLYRNESVKIDNYIDNMPSLGL